MRILVCFKVVDDLDDLLAEDWRQLTPAGPDTGCCKRVLGCFDEAALESALRLRDELADAGGAELTALTADPGYSEHLLSALPAVGYDRVACAESGADLRYDPAGTASILKEYISKNGPYDLILCGRQAPPANSGAVPLLLAEALELDAVCDAEDMRMGPDAARGALTVVSALDEGVCERDYPLPLLVTVGSARHSYLRMPTLREKLAAKNKKPEHADGLPRASSGARLVCLEAVDRSRRCVMLPKDARAAASELCESYLSEVLR